VTYVYIFPSNSVIIAYTLFDRCGKMSAGAKSSMTAASISSYGVGFGCVDILLHRFCAMCNFGVATVRV
jgi:hypothetical protein